MFLHEAWYPSKTSVHSLVYLCLLGYIITHQKFPLWEKFNSFSNKLLTSVINWMIDSLYTDNCLEEKINEGMLCDRAGEKPLNILIMLSQKGTSHLTWTGTSVLSWSLMYSMVHVPEFTQLHSESSF